MSDLHCYRCDTELERGELNQPMRFEGEQRFFCDECWLATRILLSTQPDPPFADASAYQEIVFYARQLAAATVPDPPEEVVTVPEDDDA